MLKVSLLNAGRLTCGKCCQEYDAICARTLNEPAINSVTIPHDFFVIDILYNYIYTLIIG
jgi:hypothetical protein